MMNKQLLTETIEQLFSDNKGLLAMDESLPTCNKRFAAAGIPQTEEMRRQYRELIVTTPKLHEAIGGAILFDETIRQQTADGTLMAEKLIQNGIIPGIKVDKGAIAMSGFPGEKITEGLDGLADRLTEYKKLGARFAKWRAVITIGEKIPSSACLYANAEALSRYAATCQEADIVPIVEPEVLMDGDHDLQRCYEVSERTQKILFDHLYRHRVFFGGIILKPNMVIAGSACKTQNSVDEIAKATVECLRSTTPAAVPAIAFLSGGQSPEDASKHLNAMHKNFGEKLPWVLSFSFARAIQQPALDAWAGKAENIVPAQNLLYEKAKQNVLARAGNYL
ncbi:MAG: fructose-bisphosphate aldolase class I [Chitinophagaceae bacterium]